MTAVIPQVNVIITLSGTGSGGIRAQYAYCSPDGGVTRTAASQCDLRFKRATNTLFVLDYASTLAGWTIEKSSPNPPAGPALPFQPGPQGGSLLTLDAHQDTLTYNFYIHYKNTLTGEGAAIDPQEGNEPGTV